MPTHNVSLPERLDRALSALLAERIAENSPVNTLSALVREALEHYVVTQALAHRAEGVERYGLEAVRRALNDLQGLEVSLLRQAAAKDRGRRAHTSILPISRKKEEP